MQGDYSEHHLLPQRYPIIVLNSFLGQTQAHLDYRQPFWTSPCHFNQTYNEQTSKILHIFPLFCQHISNKKTLLMYLMLKIHKIEKYWVSSTLLIIVPLMASEQQSNKIFNKDSLLLQVSMCSSKLIFPWRVVRLTSSTRLLIPPCL